MKIDDNHVNLGMVNNKKETAVHKQSEETQGVQKGTDKDYGSGAEISLSNTSVEFSKASKVVANTPAERTQLIEETKEKIENGTFQVDSREIADKILKEALSDLLNPG